MQRYDKHERKGANLNSGVSPPVTIVKRIPRMDIRYVKIEEEQKVMALLKQFPEAGAEQWDFDASAKTFRKIVHDFNIGTILVAVDGEDVLGVLTLSYPTALRCSGIYASIEEFIVDEKGRGKGIGGKLLKAAINEVSSRGCRELIVNKPSESGYPVCLKHGFKDAGRHLKILLA